MINWSTLESDIKSWLEDLGEKTVSDTAAHFANKYASAVSNGADPMMNTVIPPGKESAIESAWAACFSQMEKSDMQPTPATWAQVDSATISYWTGAMFQFAIPPPPTTIPVPGINQVTFPGAPGPLAAAINDAMTSEDPGIVASTLVGGFKDHLSMVMGVYNGSISTPGGPVPTPVPWAGVS